jgi:hypothetical protein
MNADNTKSRRCLLSPSTTRAGVLVWASALVGLLSACGSESVPEDLTDAAVFVPDAAGDASPTDLAGPSEDIFVPPADVEDDDATDAADSADDADTPMDVVPVPDTVERECETRADCNDGLECTLDRCSDEGLCEWSVAPETCLIGSQCRTTGAASPQNSCLACLPAENPFGYSTRSDGSSCDDGNECTVFDVCAAGACGGDILECEDDNQCTTNACDPDSGCTFQPLPDGDSCDDSNACTDADECLRGSCEGRAVVCNDSNACTDDTCDPESGCEAIDHDRSCSDGNACTVENFCSDGACGEGEPRDCDDGNPCTIDLCDDLVGCVHLPTLSPCCTGAVSICDDSDPCTSDICDPDTLDCAYEFNTAPCSDGNVCTAGDACVEGACVSGGPRVCDDSDECTTDFCRPGVGCDVTPLTGTSCEDGNACTGPDTCSSGSCEAGESICTCEPVLGADAIVLTSVAIGASGRPGQALNLDRNLATCAPSGNCQDGLDNALSVLASFANEPLADGVADGSISILLDFDDIQRNPFNTSVYTAEPNEVDPACVPADGECTYTVSRGSFDTSCAPIIGLPGTRSGANVAAGGDSSIFRLEIPFGEDGSLALTLYRVRFQGTATFDGPRISGLSGIIAGAVRKADLLTAIQSIPDESLPIDRASIVTLLNVVVQNDIDTDGDNVLDAASIGLVVSGIPATITGVSE